MQFLKFYATSSTTTDNAVPPVTTRNDVEVFSVDFNKTIIVLSIEISSIDDADCLLKQKRGSAVIFQSPFSLTENDFLGFSHKQVYCSGDSLVLNASTDNLSIVVHCLEI